MNNPLRIWLEDHWYRPQVSWPLRCLLPLEWLFAYLSRRRRAQYREGRKPVWQAPIPIIVVGNIVLGGTGKTPFVIWLAETLQAKGWKVGIVSRGYGGQSRQYPVSISANLSALDCGDEPMLLWRRLQVPVVVDPNRSRAAQFMLERERVDVIISDDGLQHYALGRHLELALVDAVRAFGNRHLLPVGPLRESTRRLEEVDFIVLRSGAPTLSLAESEVEHNDKRHTYSNKQHCMIVRPTAWVNCKSFERKALAAVPLGQVHAVAGIAGPEKFFTSLKQLGIFNFIPHAFPDHHRFSPADLSFNDDLPIVMTEKDAVKCVQWATEAMWYLELQAQLSDATAELIVDATRAAAAKLKASH